jgi:sarcosine oxidase subunit beta
MWMAQSGSWYDAAVIGGGIVGTAVAYYLAREGMRRVVLLERDELGSGTTAGSFGGVRQQFTSPIEIEMSRRGLDFWKSAESRFDSPCPFSEDGYLLLTGQEGIRNEFAAAADLQRAMGLGDVHLLEPAEITNVVPWLSTEGLVAGCWTPGDGHVTPGDGVVALARAARSLGVRIMEHFPVEGLRRSGDGWVIAGPEPVEAEQVVLATGYWTPALLGPLGVDIDIRLNTQYLAITEPVMEDQRVPMTIDVDTGFCLERHGPCLLLSVLGRTPMPASHEELMYEFTRRAAVRAPALLQVRVAKNLTASPATGGDGMPYVGEVEPGLWTACFVGHGAMHGPPVAELVARAMAGRPDETVDMTIWDPRREPAPVNSVWWRRPPPAPDFIGGPVLV